MCSCVECVKKKGESRIQSVLRVFDIRRGYVLKVFHGVLLVSYNERENCLAENLHSMICFGILRPKGPPLSSENKLSRSIFFFVDKIKQNKKTNQKKKTMEGFLSSSISSVCFS